jgi:hypothetical protein
MVARGAGLDAPRTRQIGRNCAADRARLGWDTEQSPVIHRLESEFLPACGNKSLDLGQWRPGLGRQYEFFRLVQRNPGEPGQIEGGVPLRGAADRPLRAVADDLDRLAAGKRPLDRLLDLLDVTWSEVICHRGILFRGIGPG